MNSYIKLYKWRSVFDKTKSEIGFISWILLNLDNKKIIWLIYKKWFINYDYILFDKDFFLLNDIYVNNLLLDNKNYYEIISKKVLNQDFEYLWDVFDVDFDKFFNLKNIYIDCWYEINANTKINKKKIKNFISKKINKFWVKNILEINQNYIIIQDKNILRENKKTLENISKIFINIPKPSYNINFLKHEQKRTF